MFERQTIKVTLFVCADDLRELRELHGDFTNEGDPVVMTDATVLAGELAGCGIRVRYVRVDGVNGVPGSRWFSYVGKATQNFDPYDFMIPLQLADKMLGIGFVDQSWHNDVCPKFELDLDSDCIKDDVQLFVRIWCNAVNPEHREGGGSRYDVWLLDNEIDGYNGVQLFETDDSSDLIKWLDGDLFAFIRKVTPENVIGAMRLVTEARRP